MLLYNTLSTTRARNASGAAVNALGRRRGRRCRRHGTGLACSLRRRCWTPAAGPGPPGTRLDAHRDRDPPPGGAQPARRPSSPWQPTGTYADAVDRPSAWGRITLSKSCSGLCAVHACAGFSYEALSSRSKARDAAWAPQTLDRGGVHPLLGACTRPVASPAWTAGRRPEPPTAPATAAGAAARLRRAADRDRRPAKRLYIVADYDCGSATTPAPSACAACGCWARRQTSFPFPTGWSTAST